MKSRFNKSGMSEVISTIGVILLSFAAIVILIAYLVPFTQDSLSNSSECLNYKDYFSFESENGYLCYNSTSGKSFVSVRAKSTKEEFKENVKGFKLIFYEGSNSFPLDVYQSESFSNLEMLNGSGNCSSFEV